MSVPPYLRMSSSNVKHLTYQILSSVHHVGLPFAAWVVPRDPIHDVDPRSHGNRWQPHNRRRDATGRRKSSGRHILTSNATTAGATFDVSSEAFAILFHARTLSTFAAKFMGEIRLLLVWDALFELGVKGLWISGEDIAHCILTLLLEILRVVTSQTATNLPAVYFDRKTLTV